VIDRCHELVRRCGEKRIDLEIDLRGSNATDPIPPLPGRFDRVLDDGLGVDPELFRQGELGMFADLPAQLIALQALAV
jgi:hypothetical protein